MAPRHWSRERIEEFVAGKVLYLRDAAVAPVAPAPWLSEVAAQVGRATSEERMMALHPDDWAAYTAAFEAVVNDPGRVVDLEYRVAGGDWWVWEEYQAVNLLDHPEVGAIVVAVDVVGVAEPRLPEQRPPALAVEAPAPWFVAFLDSTGVTRAVRGDVEDVLGVPADDLLDRYLIEWMHPDFHVHVYSTIVALRMAHGSISHDRLCFVRPGGERVWVDASAVNMLGHYGEGDIVVSFVDITEHVQAAEAATAAEDALAAAADAMTTAFYRADELGRLVLTNHLWPDLFAGADDAADLVELFHPDSQPAVAATLAAADADVEGRTYPLEGLAADGETVLALTCRAVGIPGEAGRGYVGTAMDITDHAFTSARAEGDELFETSDDPVSPGAATT